MSEQLSFCPITFEMPEFRSIDSSVDSSTDSLAANVDILQLEQKKTSIMNDEKLRKECSNEYSELSSYEKDNIDSTINTVKDILIAYKSMSYMYADWLDCKNNRNTDRINANTHHIYQKIGYFVMTRIIDEKYIEIPHYRKSINNPFHRGLWHMASSVDFAALCDHISQNGLFDKTTNIKSDTDLKIDSKSISKSISKKKSNTMIFNDSLFVKVLKYFDVFCLLSRKKTVKEFESSYRTIYRCVTSESNNDKIKIPYWIYDKYSDLDPINLFLSITQTEQHLTLVPALTLKRINPNMLFFRLSDSLKVNKINIGSLFQTVTHSDEYDDQNDIRNDIQDDDHNNGYDNDSSNYQIDKQFNNHIDYQIDDYNDYYDGTYYDTYSNCSKTQSKEINYNKNIPQSKYYKNGYTQKTNYERKFGKYGYLSTKNMSADLNKNWRSRKP
jgi:hypothetical protein